MILLLCPSAYPVLPVSSLDNTNGPIKWYVSTFMPGKKDVATRKINLGSSKVGTTVSLASGWSCEVGDASINDSRQTVCIKEKEQVAFSVECDNQKKKDHTQLRFNSPTIKFDFIEVGCETVK